MTPDETFVSVIAPLRDCAPIVDSFLDDLTALLRDHYANWEVVLVDDGSRDDTVARLRAQVQRTPGLRMVRLSRPFGDQVAISAGLDSVIGDFVAVLLPNQHPPKLIPPMVELANETGIVLACRRTRSTDTLMVRLGAALFRGYCRRVLGITLPKRATSYCVLSRRVVNALTRDRCRLRDLRLLSLLAGFATRSVTFDEIDRGMGPYRRSFAQQLNLALAIMVNGSRHPLRFACALALAGAGFNLLWPAVFMWSEWSVTAPSQLWIVLPVAAGMFCVCVVLAVMGEVVGQLLLRGEDRPMYYVMEELDGPSPVLAERRRNVVHDSLPVERDASKRTVQ